MQGYKCNFLYWHQLCDEILNSWKIKYAKPVHKIVDKDGFNCVIHLELYFKQKQKTTLYYINASLTYIEE